MKLHIPTTTHRSDLRQIAAIPFQRVERTLTKADYATFKLRTEPTNDASPVYEFAMPYYLRGTVEEWFIFCRNFKKVITGLNIQGGPAKYAMARRLLHDNVLAVFEDAVAKFGNETLPNFNKCIRYVTHYVLPHNALQVQKRYMRRDIYKTKEMTVRTMVSRINEMKHAI